MDTCPIPSNPNNTTQSLRIKILRSAVPPSHPHSRSRRPAAASHGSLAVTAARPPAHASCSFPAAHRSLAVAAARPPARASSCSFPIARHSLAVTSARPCLLLLQRLRGLSKQRPAHLLKHYLGWCCAAGARRWRAATAAGARLWTARAAAREGEDEPRPPEKERRSRGRRSWPLHRERERECVCWRLRNKTTDIHSWNRRTCKIRLVLFSFVPSLF